MHGLCVQTLNADVRAYSSAVFVVGVAPQVMPPILSVCTVMYFFLGSAAYVCGESDTYYNAHVPSNKVLEHVDDILLRSCFLEVGSTRTVTFLKVRTKGPNEITAHQNDFEGSHSLWM